MAGGNEMARSSASTSALLVSRFLEKHSAPFRFITRFYYSMSRRNSLVISIPFDPLNSQVDGKKLLEIDIKVRQIECSIMLLAQAESFFMISIFPSFPLFLRNENDFFANDSWWISFRKTGEWQFRMRLGRNVFIKVASSTTKSFDFVSFRGFRTRSFDEAVALSDKLPRWNIRKEFLWNLWAKSSLSENQIYRINSASFFIIKGGFCHSRYIKFNDSERARQKLCKGLEF